MKDCTDLILANFYFSAFVSASRSVTFALQAVMDGQPGFAEWYSTKQNDMGADPVFRFFKAYRNEVLKTGKLPIVAGNAAIHAKRKGEKTRLEFRFDRAT